MLYSGFKDKFPVTFLQRYELKIVLFYSGLAGLFALTFKNIFLKLLFLCRAIYFDCLITSKYNINNIL